MNLSSRMTFFLLALGMALVWMAYLPALDAKLFTLDDLAVLMAPHISSPLSFESLRTIFTPGASPDYYPIRDLSYVADFLFFGQDRVLFRVHSLLVFTEIALILFFILRHLGISRSSSVIATLLWAAHPVHVEMVIWINARKDLLALVYGGASIIAYLKARERASTGLYLLSGFLLSLSYLSKASLALLPLIAFLGSLLWKLDPKSIDRPSRLRHSAFLFFACALAVKFALFTRHYYSSVNDMSMDYSLGYRLQASAIAFSKMLLGWVSANENVVDVENWGAWVRLNQSYFTTGLVFWVGLMGFLVFSALKRNKMLLLYAGAFLLLYLPVSGIVFPHRNFYSVRYLEPCFLLVAVAITQFSSSKGNHPWIRNSLVSIQVACAVGFVYLLSATYSEAKIWSEPLRVIDKALSLNPGSMSLKILRYTELIRLTKDHPNEASYLVERNDLSEELRKRCLSALQDEKLECSGFWSALLGESTSAEVSSKEELLKLATDSLRASKATMPWALTSELGYRLSWGTADLALAADWHSHRQGVFTPHQRVLEWVAICWLKSPESARAQLAEYYRRVLMPAQMAERFVYGYVHAQYRPALQQCL